MRGLLAQASTSTTIEEVKRVVGDPPAPWIVIVAGLALLLVILAAGIWARRRQT